MLLALSEEGDGGVAEGRAPSVAGSVDFAPDWSYDRDEEDEEEKEKEKEVIDDEDSDEEINATGSIARVDALGTAAVSEATGVQAASQDATKQAAQVEDQNVDEHAGAADEHAGAVDQHAVDADEHDDQPLPAQAAQPAPRLFEVSRRNTKLNDCNITAAGDDVGTYVTLDSDGEGRDSVGRGRTCKQKLERDERR